MEKSRCIQQLWAHASILLAVLAVSFAQKTAVKNFVSASAKCQVYERIPCGDPAFGQAACEAINCCFDGQQCYYGNAVTVQCTRDGQFVVVVAKDSTVPQLDVASVSLLGGNAAPCLPVATTNAFAIYTFPVTACGTVVKVDGDYVVYENRMTSSYEVGVGPLGSITRDSLYEYMVTGFPSPPMLVSAGAAAYTSYYQDSDYPVTKVLRQPVYVEVRILNRTDPNLVLVLENCWATPGLDPLSLPQWSLLVDGCPYQGDKYQTTLVPVDASSGLPFPTHYKRFIVKMFAFVDPASQRRYQGKGFIHCSVAVCRPSATDSCEQRCFRKGRDVAAAHKSSSPDTTVVSSGEMHLVAPRVGHMAGRW
ncbi:zona pellucida sperm-binding protein 4-like isoform X3 [Brienomyrus brachyistius]|uniref:zona pellucida sperm-binding protein 4-like isoform X3 n=1 Tax=Brienomyrus brachyistius TaxID=42636 RepID=UPI0020B27644|nr:zona pellucida sperm-binding protein 4-like isoform X3 [Brienomyrus brachyistius]